MMNLLDRKKILLSIIAVGIVLRVWHIDWSLPEVYEEATPFMVSWKFWNWGQQGLDFNPYFFHYPALTFCVQFIVQALHYGVGHLVGTYPNLDAFRQAYESNPTSSLVLARLVNVLFDLGTILATYVLAKRHADSRVGLVASALVAINPLLIEQAHLVSVDGPLTFFSVLSLMFTSRIASSSRWKWYLLGGLTIGLASAAKYIGALLIAPLMIAHLLQSHSLKEGFRSLLSARLVVALALSGLVFLLLNPYVLLQFQNFLRDFRAEQFHMSYGHFGVTASSSTWAVYALQVLPGCLGWVFYLIILASTVYFVVRREGADIVLVAFPIIFFAVVMSWEMRADRYVLPVVPILILIGACGVVRLWDTAVGYAKSHVPRGFPRERWHATVAGVLVGLAVSIQPLYGAFRYHRSFLLPDTRAVAKGWIVDHLSPGSVVAMAPLGLTLSDPLIMYPIPFTATRFEEYAPFYDARWYQQYDLAVGSSHDYARFMQEPEKYGDFLRYYYDSLQTRWALVFTVEPSAIQAGPQIWLYSPKSLQISPEFDQCLLERLGSVRNATMVMYFLKNHVTILAAKGIRGKAQQLQRFLVSYCYRRGLLEEARKESDAYLRSYPTDRAMSSLRDSIVVRMTQDASGRQGRD
jgi:4-amino-4-deoxy-L-arabinose transferase-like glycosyltransferase